MRRLFRLVGENWRGNARTWRLSRMPASGNSAGANASTPIRGAMCWAGLSRTAAIAARLGLAERARHWQQLSDRIGETLLKRCWNEKRQAFAAAEGIDDMDASVLLLPELGLIDAQDPRFASTVAAIEKDLVRGRHVMRYAAEDDFGLPETEFLVCRFWLIDALALLGRREEARERYQDALALRNRYGLFAEDIHPQTGALWGNFPQTYSMAGVDPERHAAQSKLGGPLLARIFIISNRVAIPKGRHPSGRAGSGAQGHACSNHHLCVAGLERRCQANIPRTRTIGQGQEQLYHHRSHP